MGDAHVTDAVTIGASGAASADVPPLDDVAPDEPPPFAPDDPPTDDPEEPDEEDVDPAGPVASFAVEGSSKADVPQATTTDPTSSTRTAVRTLEQLL